MPANSYSELTKSMDKTTVGSDCYLSLGGLWKRGRTRFNLMSSPFPLYVMEKHLVSLNLNFLFCKMGTIEFHSSQGLYKESTRTQNMYETCDLLKCVIITITIIDIYMYLLCTLFCTWNSVGNNNYNNTLK